MKQAGICVDYRVLYLAIKIVEAYGASEIQISPYTEDSASVSFVITCDRFRTLVRNNDIITGSVFGAKWE